MLLVAVEGAGRTGTPQTLVVRPGEEGEVAGERGETALMGLDPQVLLLQMTKEVHLGHGSPC